MDHDTGMVDPAFPWQETTDVGGQFRTTAWSEILNATQGGDPAQALEAWEYLCRAYWKPVYAHIRRLGNPAESAKDLTQGFFFHLLRRERLKRADRSRGKFRSFLLTSLNRFLHSEWDRRIAQKRDERLVISLDQGSQEGEPAIDLPGGLSPDQCFERDWAKGVFARVRARLAKEMQLKGKAVQLALLPAALYESDAIPYRTLAQDLNVSESHVKKRVQRLRERWGEILREEVLATVEQASEVEEEIRYLVRIADE